MKYLLTLTAWLLFLVSQAQNIYWQQRADVTITASLNTEGHTIDGFENIVYTNNSPDTLYFIWFHLWPNAYKNDRTALSEQLLQNDRTDFYFAQPRQLGYINRLNFVVDGQPATLEPSTNIDVVKLVLPGPLAPKHSATIATPFHVQLPEYFSRSGHISGDYQVTQWYPKPAVYDSKGWHPMPYLDQGEFYSEFGDYDVQLTVPAGFTVAATGVLQNEEDVRQLKTTGTIQNTGATHTWHYRQQNVHDFAWFASKSFEAHYDSTILPSGKKIDVFSFYKKGQKGWDHSLQYTKDGLQFYSRLLGDYPYSTMSVVAGPDNVSSGGMEYPTITLITTSETGKMLDVTIVHETGHNWFYGALASNERQHPWMDEGMNSYYENRYEQAKYSSTPSAEGKKNNGGKLPANEAEMLLRTMQQLGKDEPIDLPAAQYNALNYGLSVYVKGAQWMQLLENKMGTATFDSAMQRYYRQWAHRHPYPAHFRQVMEQVYGQSLTAEFALLQQRGPLKPDTIKKQLKPSLIFNLHQTDKYQYVNLAPVVGYNNYDRLMPGIMVHNYQLPLPKLAFIAGGMYGSASKKLNSFGRVAYHVRKHNYDAEGAMSLLNFSQNDFGLISGTVLYPRVTRIVPSARLTLYPDAHHHNRRWIFEWKSYLLQEDQLDFRTIITPTDTLDEVGLLTRRTAIHRLSAGVQNNRALYPYSLQVTAEKGPGFIRTGLTGKYFFNYSDGKQGLSARLFAGKFFYTESRTILNRINADRYALNMTGPKGYEDYTYSNYFIGRNEFQRFMSQQIMERDGFFKVRTDLLSNKIGKTDDWLMSLNLVSDLPDRYNPLQVLPVKIPLKVFADVGTYADAWKNNPATGRFLFDGGLQLSLARNLVNVYIPLVYSRVYSDYFKSTITQNRFLRNISFSIDIQNIKARHLLANLPL